MNWRFVLQPDGLLARFCDGQMDFTDFALTEDEAQAECQRIRMSADTARRVIQDALEDRCHLSGKAGGPLHRWNEAVHAIRFEHGNDHCEFAMSEMGFADYAAASGGKPEPAPGLRAG